MLQFRSSHAQAVSDVYIFAAEYLRINTEDHIFQVQTLLIAYYSLINAQIWFELLFIFI